MVHDIIITYNFGELLENIAKKGSETDIRYYNRKKNDKISVFLDPFRFPEKLSALTNSVSVASAAILNIQDFNRDLGEIILTLDAFNITIGAIIARQEIKEKLQKILKNTALEHFEIINKDIASILSFIDSVPYASKESKGYVVVDQTFPVKGTGTVALGFVKEGYIERHEQLRVFPGPKKTEIRSIQSQDIDVDRAEDGTRVGVALKNIDVEDVPKGSVLALDDAFQVSNTIKLKIVKNTAVPYDLEIDQKVQVHFAMNTVVAKVSDISGSYLLLDMEREIPLMPVRYVIVALDKVPRIYAGGYL